MLFALAVLAALPVLVIALIAGLRAPVRVLLASYAFILPLGSSITLPGGLPSPFNTVSSLAGLLVLVGMFGHLALGRRSARHLLPAVPAWMMFTAFAGLSIAWSVDPAATAKAFLVLATLLLFYVVAMLLPAEPPDVARVEEAIIGGGVVAGLYGLVLLATSGLQLTRRDIPRFATAGGVGEGTDPNITAATLVLPFALALSRALRSRTAAGRAGFGAAAGIIGIGIMLTGSRGGMLAALVSAFVALVASEHRRKGAIVLLIVGLAGTITFIAAPKQLRTRVFQSWSSGRTDIWRTGLSACERYCWAGAGWGTFPTVYLDELHTNPGARGLDRPFVAHNIYISAALETGVIGFGLMMFAIGISVRDLFRLPRAVRAPPLAGIAGLMVASMFLTTVTFKYFWLVMIYAGLMSHAYSRREHVARPAWSRALQPINA
jgi:O-antigen ligase